eukprot:TRINITY_DN33694_c0_g1_i1.p1 TRINITY_DN33694_c0_g1~~TRINITY_DN33694_c0_g1_i1.p1  ORF type:complete len:685 (-),score=88.44 TRINITY_DN33694_c0_g1_i1:26-1960(-)
MDARRCTSLQAILPTCAVAGSRQASTWSLAESTWCSSSQPTFGGARSFSRLPTPRIQPRGSDKELFEEVFEPFGVSQEQFTSLMALGTKYKAAVGTVVVESGMKRDSLSLVMKGQLIAYKSPPNSSEPFDVAHADPLCKYVGKLEDADYDAIVPVRGSVIGGSALVDKSLPSKPFPLTIVAETPIEYVEWNLQDLEEIFGTPKMRALQASFYHLLYVEIIWTIDRHRKSEMKSASKDRTVTESQAPHAGQLAQLGLFIAIPFFGFGFADNLIMIVAGDAIDAHFGATLGLTTLAAAGLGNWLSDTVGLGLGDAIERAAGRLGLSNGRLTPAQERMNIAKMTTLAGKVIGITLGCFAGMVPLLFLTPQKKEFLNEDLHLYNEAFLPSQVSTSSFADLMEKGKKCQGNEGDIIAQGGEVYGKIALLLRGKVTSTRQTHEGSVQVASYIGRLDDEAPSKKQPDKLAVPCRGSMIGAAALANAALLSGPYPNTARADGKVEWIEWDVKTLQEFMSEEGSIKAAFYAMLYADLLQRLETSKSADKLKEYKDQLAGVISDGYVTPKEREFIERQRAKLEISMQDHDAVLTELGWTRAMWDSHKTGQSRDASDQDVSPVSSEQAVEQLHRASEMIAGVARSLERSGQALVS